jgi:hypothetical protein
VRSAARAREQHPRSDMRKAQTDTVELDSVHGGAAHPGCSRGCGAPDEVGWRKLRLREVGRMPLISLAPSSRFWARHVASRQPRG